MSKIYDFFASKYFKDKDIQHKIVIDFYSLLRTFKAGSTNIAIIQNKGKFRYVVKSFEERLIKARGDTELKVNDDKYIFIIDEIETVIVRVNNIPELEKHRIKFGRYI